MIAALGLAKAALAFLLSPIGRLIGIGVIALTIGFWQGWALRDKLCDRASLKAQIVAQQRDLAIQKDTTVLAEQQATELARTADDLQKKVDEYEAERAKGSTDRCRLTDDDVRRLRNIR